MAISASNQTVTKVTAIRRLLTGTPKLSRFGIHTSSEDPAHFVRYVDYTRVVDLYRLERRPSYHQYYMTRPNPFKLWRAQQRERKERPSGRAYLSVLIATSPPKQTPKTRISLSTLHLCTRSFQTRNPQTKQIFHTHPTTKSLLSRILPPSGSLCT